MDTLPGLLIALSNCWGLLLVIVFLGYGVVSVPRSFWDYGNYEGVLEYHYLKAAMLEEDINSSAAAFDEAVKLICYASQKLPKQSMLQTRMEDLLRMCPDSLKELHCGRSYRRADMGLGVITEGTLVKLHTEFKAALTRYRQAKIQMVDCIPKAIYVEDIMAAAKSPFKRIMFSLNSGDPKRLPRTREAVRWYWLILIKPALYKMLAVLLFAMSFLVVLGESTLFLNFPVGVFPLMFKEDLGMIASQILCLIPLSYIVWCTYYGMFQLKLPGWYGLYSKNTEPSSLVYCAFYLARLSAPLAFNFFLFVKVEESVFFETVGVTDFAMKACLRFSQFFPGLLIVFSILNIVHAYGRILKLLGISQLSYIDGSQQHQIYEGKSIVRREKALLLREHQPEKNAATWELMDIEIMRDSSNYSPIKLLE